MAMPLIEVVLRTAASLALLSVAIVLLAGRRDPQRWLGALCCAAVIAFILTSTPLSGALGWLLLPLTALCVTKAALLWLLARSLFDDAFRVRPAHVAACGLVALYGTWQQLGIDRREPLDATSAAAVAGLGFEVLVLTLVALALFEAWRGLAGDLVERRRRLRVLVVAAGGAYVAMASLVQGYNLLMGTQTSPLLVSLNLALMFALGCAALVTLVQPRTADWLSANEPSAASRLDASERQALAALTLALERDAIYRQEGLTIGRLAAHLRVPEYLLRRVINRGLGFRNFNDFLHSYRLREACDRLGRRDQEHLPVLSIALDAGYASIGPFNRAFKARLGLTPTAYRQAAREKAATTPPIPESARLPQESARRTARATPG
jgi:AraC-like DNA-binding protein